MAHNLLRAGTRIVAWNRTASKTCRLMSEGAAVASDIDGVFRECKTVLLMLVDGPATDAALGRGTDRFESRVRDHLVVSMSTPAPQYSASLALDIARSGGRYVEAPVSGSRKPAEAGQLVAMLAGMQSDIEQLKPLIAPMCRAAIECGPIPNALLMKLAVNLFLSATVVGLAEAVQFARSNGLNLEGLLQIINAGQMASDLSKVKLPKLISKDYTVQASINNAHANVSLISEAAQRAGIVSPVLDTCVDLFGEARAMGLAEADMVAVLDALERRTRSRSEGETGQI